MGCPSDDGGGDGDHTTILSPPRGGEVTWVLAGGLGYGGQVAGAIWSDFAPVDRNARRANTVDRSATISLDRMSTEG